MLCRFGHRKISVFNVNSQQKEKKKRRRRRSREKPILKIADPIWLFIVLSLFFSYSKYKFICRYFVLTRDYLHCFKRATGSINERISDMGQFIFKIKLVDVEKVEWLNRRSYSAISLFLGREGRVLLRTDAGLEDWFELLEVCASQLWHIFFSFWFVSTRTPQLQFKTIK